MSSIAPEPQIRMTAMGPRSGAVSKQKRGASFEAISFRKLSSRLL